MGGWIDITPSDTTPPHRRSPSSHPPPTSISTIGRPGRPLLNLRTINIPPCPIMPSRRHVSQHVPGRSTHSRIVRSVGTSHSTELARAFFPFKFFVASGRFLLGRVGGLDHTPPTWFQLLRPEKWSLDVGDQMCCGLLCCRVVSRDGSRVYRSGCNSMHAPLLKHSTVTSASQGRLRVAGM